MLGNSEVTAQLAASQEGLSSIELVELIQFRFKYFNMKHNTVYGRSEVYFFSKNWDNKSVVGFTYFRPFEK
jgi:hypothetical protein